MNKILAVYFVNTQLMDFLFLLFFPIIDIGMHALLWNCTPTVTKNKVLFKYV